VIHLPFLPVAGVVLGIGVLTMGAEALVRGAAGLAERLGLSSLVVGLTVVAFGTSMPELAVSVGSAWIGNGGVALGNVVGSNIFNVLVVLGGAALIRPMVVHRQLVRLDVPVMIGAVLLVVLLSLDGRLGYVDGSVLVTLGLLYTAVAVWQGRRASRTEGDELPALTAVDSPRSDHALATSGTTTLPSQIAWILFGLWLLAVGARLVVVGAVEVARVLGVSDLVVGLTVVAAGTSLPELATSFVAAARNQRDIAVGNVVGSNVFNTLVVLGAAALVDRGGMPVPQGVRTFDLLVMLGVSMACLPIFFTGWTVSRREGALFLAYYVAYLAYLILHHLHHAGEDLVGTALIFFALPLTVLTVGLHVFRQLRAPTRRAADP
jgi:cation:H+ antiporter